MAKARKITTTHTVMRPVKVKQTTVTLTLSQEEAQFLTDVMARISGSTMYSRRKYQEGISVALATAGLSFNTKDLLGNIACSAVRSNG